MRTVMQCARCMARDKDPHKTGCRGRKVSIPVYGKADIDLNVRPVNIMVTDNGGRTADRYTIFRKTPGGAYKGWPFYFYGNSSRDPYHPQGVGITSEDKRQLWLPRYRTEGEKPVKWATLPEGVRRFAWHLAIDDNE